MSLKKFSSSSIVLVIAGIGVILGLVGFSCTLLKRFVAATVFSRAWRKFNYIGAVFFLCIPVALVLVWALSYWLSRDERDFRDRFGKKEVEENKVDF